jgi:hypothetical protein
MKTCYCDKEIGKSLNQNNFPVLELFESFSMF